MNKNRDIAILLLILCTGGYALLNVAVRMMGAGFGPITEQNLIIFAGMIIVSVYLMNKVVAETG